MNGKRQQQQAEGDDEGRKFLTKHHPFPAELQRDHLAGRATGEIPEVQGKHAKHFKERDGRQRKE